MRRSTVEDLARDPVGRYVAGETFAHFCATPTFWGFMLWGRPTEAHAIELGRSLVLELAPPAVPHASIIDASRLEGGEAGAFGAAERYLTKYGDALRDWVLKLAMVRPSGFGGALVAGAYEVLPRPYPVAIFHEIETACAWLELDALAPSEAAALLDELHADASGISRVVGSLRALLDGHLAGISLGGAAAALGMSEQSLQRKLGDEKTTFQDELADARVRAAKELLADLEKPLTAIAYEVGCASLQHFSALFKKRTRESPSAFRQRRRARDAGEG